MVRAQVTAWSERRSQAGASAAAVIMGCPFPSPCWAVVRCGELQYIGPHRHRWLCAAIMALIGDRYRWAARWGNTIPGRGRGRDPSRSDLHQRTDSRPPTHVRRADRHVARRGRHRRVPHHEGGPGGIPRAPTTSSTNTREDFTQGDPRSTPEPPLERCSGCTTGGAGSTCNPIPDANPANRTMRFPFSPVPRHGQSPR